MEIYITIRFWHHLKAFEKKKAIIQNKIKVLKSHRKFQIHPKKLLPTKISKNNQNNDDRERNR